VPRTPKSLLSEKNYRGLLAARTGLAAFVQLSERDARAAGTTHAQHHVLLALRGHDDDSAPTVKDIAAALGVASPSAVELIARMVGAGLLRRQDDASDRRVTRLRLTRLGEKLLHQLSENHFPRLRELHRKGTEYLLD
jgi:DNA-binding MarR family transcriptional regulator